MACAWSPSIQGAKAEDTMLLTDYGPQVLTTPLGWPMWTTTQYTVPMERPAIWEKR
jgi:hypothetical protein